MYSILEVKEQNIFNLEEVKNFLRVSHNEDDVQILNITIAAIEHCELFLRVSIIERLIETRFKVGYKTTRIALPVIPALKVNSISKESKFSLIKNEYLDFESPINSEVTISYSAGYRQLPGSLRYGMLLHIAQMYDKEIIGNVTEDIQKIYQQHRRLSL